MEQCQYLTVNVSVKMKYLKFTLTYRVITIFIKDELLSRIARPFLNALALLSS